MKLIYFHGFGSSAATGTVETLKELLPDFEVLAPDIPIDPAEALPYLQELCKKESPDVIVGTSMGGMYTQQMFGYKRICVNPAFEMSEKSTVLKVGTFEYFKPRMDGETHFTITENIIKHHVEMEKCQFDGITSFDRTNVWGLFGNEDTQVNCEDLFRKYYSNVIHYEGGHRMNRTVIMTVLVPLIRKITDFDFNYSHLCELVSRLNHRLLEIVMRDKKGLVTEKEVVLSERNEELDDCYSALSLRYIREINREGVCVVCIHIEFKDGGCLTANCYVGTPDQIRRQFSFRRGEKFVREIVDRMICECKSRKEL